MEPAPAESPVVSSSGKRATSPAAQAVPTRGRLVDRVVTIGLIAYGLFVVVSSFVALTDFSSFANMWMDTVGIEGEFTNVAQGRLWGTIAAAVFGRP